MSFYPITFNDRWELPRGGGALRTDIERLLAGAWILTAEDEMSLASDAALGRRSDSDDEAGARPTAAAGWRPRRSRQG